MAAHRKNKKKRIPSPRKNGVAVFGYTFSRTLVTTTAVFVLALLLSLRITTTQLFSPAKSGQNVLGESKENREEGKKQETKKEIPISKSFEMNRSKIKTENTSSDGVRTKTKLEKGKQETRIETPDGQKIKTKTEDDGRIKIEVENDSLKMQYVVENGKVVLKSDEEAEDEIEDEDIQEVEEINGDDTEETDTTPNKSSKLVFVNNNIGATTDFPVSVDTATNTLIVSTPEGEKTVTVLPDQAVTNLLSTGVVNSIDSSTDTNGETGSLDGVVKIIVKNNEAVYEVQGKKTHKVFGFIPVSTSKKVVVSAETGKSISQEQSIFASIVERLSP